MRGIKPLILDIISPMGQFKERREAIWGVPTFRSLGNEQPAKISVKLLPVSRRKARR